MIGWLLLLAGGSYVAYKYAGGAAPSTSTSPSATAVNPFADHERPPKPVFKGKYRDRLLQALQWYAHGWANAPSTAELQRWITHNDHVVEIARRHKIKVIEVASALAKDGGSGNYLYRAFPDEKIPRK